MLGGSSLLLGQSGLGEAPGGGVQPEKGDEVGEVIVASIVTPGPDLTADTPQIGAEPTSG